MNSKKIHIIESYTGTGIGRAIKYRARLHFWDRHGGDSYSHISFSKDDKLDDMMSFARKSIRNPFRAGLVKENIRKGIFALRPNISKMVVMEISITDEQYDKLTQVTNQYWENKDQYKYNFPGLFSMLLRGKGIALKNKFFCSQWVAAVLQESGIDIFNGRRPEDIRPFDFYEALENSIIYEGLIIKYPKYNACNN